MLRLFQLLALCLFFVACTKEGDDEILRSSDSSLLDLEVDGITIDGFSPEIKSYNYKIVANQGIPVVEAIPRHSGATVTVHSPPSVPGTATAQVIAENGSSASFYHINFGYDFNNDTSVTVPGEFIFYDLKTDFFKDLDFHYDNGSAYNGATITNGIMSIASTQYVIINFNLPQKTTDYSKIYVEVEANSGFSGYISINEFFSVTNEATYFEFENDAAIDIKKEFSGFREDLNLQLIVRDTYISHLRVSGDL